jgi:hypothetical protein
MPARPALAVLPPVLLDVLLAVFAAAASRAAKPSAAFAAASAAGALLLTPGRRVRAAAPAAARAWSPRQGFWREGFWGEGFRRDALDRRDLDGKDLRAMALAGMSRRHFADAQKHEASARGPRRKTLRRLPADRMARSPHHPPRAGPICTGRPGGPSLSLADALRRRPRRHLHRLYRKLAFRSLAPDVAGLTVKSPNGSERTAPKFATSSSSLPCASQEPSSSRRVSPSLPSSPCCPPS